MNDSQTLWAIRDLMDGQEWTPDTLNQIADLVRATGRDIRDTEEI